MFSVCFFPSVENAWTRGHVEREHNHILTCLLCILVLLCSYFSNWPFTSVKVLPTTIKISLKPLNDHDDDDDSITIGNCRNTRFMPMLTFTYLARAIKFNESVVTTVKKLSVASIEEQIRKAIETSLKVAELHQ